MKYEETAKATSDLIGFKMTGASKISQQNNLETVTDENDEEIPKERYISPDERQKVFDIIL